MTVKTYASAVFDLGKENSCPVSWENITKDTDTIHKLELSSFRMFGVDYNEYFRFQHKYNHELRGRKKGEVSKNHWTEEQKTKNLY